MISITEEVIKRFDNMVCSYVSLCCSNNIDIDYDSMLFKYYVFIYLNKGALNAVGIGSFPKKLEEYAIVGYRTDSFKEVFDEKIKKDGINSIIMNEKLISSVYKYITVNNIDNYDDDFNKELKGDLLVVARNINQKVYDDFKNSYNFISELEFDKKDIILVKYENDLKKAITSENYLEADKIASKINKIKGS